MDIHERYNNSKSMDISLFEIIEMTFKEDPSKLFNSMIQFYMNKLINNNMDTKGLKTFHLILRYYYQFLIEYKKSIPLGTASHLYNPKLNLILLQEETFLDTSLLCDVIILHSVLFCDHRNFKQHLINLRNSKVQVSSMYMKTMECFLQVQRLKSIHGESLESNELTSLCALYLNDMKTWLLIEDNLKWKTFASMLPKLIDIFGIDNIVFPIWDFILSQTSEDLFPALCITADTCYPIIKEYNLFTKEFWSLLTKGLKSSIKQHRKQALFLLQRTIKLVEDRKVPISIPFVCKNNNTSISDIKRVFFLILEALEEKQNHLIIPYLIRIPDLIETSNQHKICGDCFNIEWTCCVLERALKHENNTVVKLALSYTCQLNEDAFTDEFLNTFLETLNNTFLYKCEPNEHEPRIIKELIKLFIRMKKKDSNLLERFFIKLNEFSWGPIAMFYIITSIQKTTSSESYNWGDTELRAIELLINGNLNMHSQLLRTGSQIQIFKIIDNCWKRIDNLTSLGNVLSMFPEDETFTIDTGCWKIVTTWMIRVLKKSDIDEFFIPIFEQRYQINSKSFAIIVALLTDAGLILNSNKCTTGCLLKNYFQSLGGIDTRPYVDVGSSMHIVKSLFYLLKFPIKNCKKLNDILCPYLNTVFEFLLKNTRRAIESSCHVDLNSYLDIIISLLNSNSQLVDKCEREGMNFLKNEQDQNILSCLSGLKMLYHSRMISSSNDYNLFQFLYDYCIKINLPKSNNGKIVSDCYIHLTKLIRLFIVRVPINQWPKDFHLFTTISDYFDMGGNEIVLSIVQILKITIEKNLMTEPNDTNNFKFILERCWKHSFLNKNNHQSCLCIETIVELIFNGNFFALPDGNDLAIEYSTVLLQDGNNKNILIKSMNNLNSNELLNFQKPLLNCLVHGYANRNDKKIENQTSCYISSKLFSNLIQSNDNEIRARAIVLLNRVIMDQPKYGSNFLPLILSTLEKEQNKRYFNDSQLHRMKQKLVQSLLILEPILQKAEVVVLQETISHLLLIESNQPNIKMMQEWLLIRIFIKHKDLRVKLWIMYEESLLKRPGCTSSLAMIVYHVAKSLEDENRGDFIRTGLSYTSRCCLGQQFNMRLCNQMILIKLYDLLKESKQGDILKEYKGLYDATNMILKHPQSMKHCSKIFNDFYLSVFHPINDYSLQTIYLELPRLFDIDVEEWIEPNVFQVLHFQESTRHPIKIYNTEESLLSKCESLRSTDDPTIETTQRFDNVQKKIIPWNDETLDDYRKVQLEETGLVIVATLIDRLPNLGGLARTCEIFGARELIIANLDHVKNKEFQSLSVSAEKWLPISEVKECSLKEYLLMKKDMGWSLIGAEQTADSQSILLTKFEKKTILVLGNERTGIPANLIPLFDKCVEIPQNGVTRSLNVHVTGAICIWHYVTQHVFCLN